ncbi:MAG: nicotinate (nicotinamide) nucleotide adenylyltransferase [Candidatus Muiribacterium halophilum]|uniref:Probable nicotinate-nucleotide adenylyltransferase n=1 Tax=Muiribacterium halophilum TaxID=2053465 RepID=A0A2N5Z9P0_MUIH1|nr:MAG: nicotinate (nicotinamide) nucleotide adenylyltransferase [Candidatus Muirbacterium halophilum]
MNNVFFGGAFDPIHNAHLSMAKYIVEKGLASKILFVPVYNPPHRKDHILSKYKDRLNMLELAIEGSPDFLVSDIESRIDTPSYTYRTLKHLQKELNTSISLMIGEDQLSVFNTWFEYKKIIDQFQLIIFNRSKKISEELMNLLKDKDVIWTDLKHKKISSTMIRQKIKENKYEDIEDHLPEKVLKYIKENGLYRS